MHTKPTQNSPRGGGRGSAGKQPRPCEIKVQPAGEASTEVTARGGAASSKLTATEMRSPWRSRRSARGAPGPPACASPLSLNGMTQCGRPPGKSHMVPGSGGTARKECDDPRTPPARKSRWPPTSAAPPPAAGPPLPLPLPLPAPAAATGSVPPGMATSSKPQFVYAAAGAQQPGRLRLGRPRQLWQPGHGQLWLTRLRQLWRLRQQGPRHLGGRPRSRPRSSGAARARASRSSRRAG